MICILSLVGLGLFALTEGSDCDGVDYQSLIIWYISILITSLCMIPTLTLLFYRYFGSIRTASWVFTYDAKSLFQVVNFLHLIACFLFSLLKIVYKDKVLIGRDISMTLVFAFALLIPVIALVIYFLIVTNFLRQYSITLKPEIGENVLRHFNYLDKLAVSLPVLTLIPSLVPILGITIPKYRNVYAKVSLIGTGTIVFILGICVRALGFYENC